VTYNGTAEASMVPPSWHGWLHHTGRPAADRGKVHAARLVEAAPAQSHRHAPAPTARLGSTLAQGRRPKATGDYKAWKPGQ